MRSEPTSQQMRHKCANHFAFTYYTKNPFSFFKVRIRRPPSRQPHSASPQTRRLPDQSLQVRSESTQHETETEVCRALCVRILYKKSFLFFQSANQTPSITSAPLHSTRSQSSPGPESTGALRIHITTYETQMCEAFCVCILYEKSFLFFQSADQTPSITSAPLHTTRIQPSPGPESTSALRIHITTFETQM